MTQTYSEYKQHFDECLQYAKEALALYRPFNLYPLYKIPILFEVDEASDHDAHTNGKTITFIYPLAKLLSKEEFAGVLEHELDHILLLHIPRGKGKKPVLWNVAIDITINGAIRKQEPNVDYKIVIPRNSVFDSTLEHLSAEEIYAKLDKGDSSPNLQISEDKSKVSFKIEGKGSKSKEFEPDLLPNEGEGIEEVEEFGKQILRESLEATPGNTPLGMSREVTEILEKVKVDWRKELKYYITKGLRDFSYSQRDVRFMGSKFFIPGLEESPLGSIAIGVGVDLSGSMRLEELNKVLTECLGIEKAYPMTKFWFVPFDVKTYGKFEASDSMEIMRIFKNFKGGGGTSFVHVLKELDTIKESKVSVMFTDLEGEFPLTKPRKPLIWLDISGRPHEVPYGKRVQYE